MLTRKTDTEIWSLDECHFQQHGTRCAMWIPPEVKDPIVLHAPTKKSISLFGAVNLSTGRMVYCVSPVFNAVAFFDYIKMLSKRAGKNKNIFVILDNARYHHAVMLKPWLKKMKNRINLFFLPAYSPDLNPIERVWKLARRRCTHNQFFPTLAELANNVKELLNKWSVSNKTLYKLCCVV